MHISYDAQMNSSNVTAVEAQKGEIEHEFGNWKLLRVLEKKKVRKVGGKDSKRNYCWKQSWTSKIYFRLPLDVWTQDPITPSNSGIYGKIHRQQARNTCYIKRWLGKYQGYCITKVCNYKKTCEKILDLDPKQMRNIVLLRTSH